MSSENPLAAAPPETMGLAVVMAGLIRALMDSGALSDEALAGLPGRLENIASGSFGDDAEYLEKTVAVIRWVLPDG